MNYGDKVRLTEAGRAAWLRVHRTEPPENVGEIVGVGYGEEYFKASFGREEENDLPENFCGTPKEYLEVVSE